MQATIDVFWPIFEFEIQWSKTLKKVTFGFGVSDNVCNYTIEKVNGSEIQPYSSSQSSQISQQSSKPVII